MGINIVLIYRYKQIRCTWVDNLDGGVVKEAPASYRHGSNYTGFIHSLYRIQMGHNPSGTDLYSFTLEEL